MRPEVLGQLAIWVNSTLTLLFIEGIIEVIFKLLLTFAGKPLVKPWSGGSGQSRNPYLEQLAWSPRLETLAYKLQDEHAFYRTLFFLVLLP